MASGKAGQAAVGVRRAASLVRAIQQHWLGLLWQVAPLLAGITILTLAALVVARVDRGRALPPLESVSQQPHTGEAAPLFQLRDQFGAPVALESLRGRVVALTFLYSSCPDICPVTLGDFGLVRDELGGQAGDVAFLAITVDPERDDPARLRQFLAAQGLERQVAFLTGDREALERVWIDYGITVARGSAASGVPGEDYEVIHTDRIYLIDRDGCLRGLLRSTAAPQELYVSLAGLLGEGASSEDGTCG